MKSRSPSRRSKPMRTKVHRREVMELFRAEKIGELESNSSRQCRVCDNTLKIVRTVFYPHTKAAVRVFGCDCGAHAHIYGGKSETRHHASPAAKSRVKV
jgi:hypothetical protein